MRHVKVSRGYQKSGFYLNIDGFNVTAREYAIIVNREIPTDRFPFSYIEARPNSTREENVNIKIIHNYQNPFKSSVGVDLRTVHNNGPGSVRKSLVSNHSEEAFSLRYYSEPSCA